MKKLIFLVTLVLFGVLTMVTTSMATGSSHGPVNPIRTVCDKPRQEYNPGSVFCPRGCSYSMQVCVTRSHNTIIPSISYTGIPCPPHAKILLFDDTVDKKNPISTKGVDLSCDISVSQTLSGKAMFAVGLHRYRAEFQTGPWSHGWTPGDNGWFNEGDSPDITVPLTPASDNRYYTPIYRVNYHGRYR